MDCEVAGAATSCTVRSEYGDQSTNYLLQDGDIIVVPPNAFARVGFVLQTLLFPFQQIFSAGLGAATVSRTF